MTYKDLFELVQAIAGLPNSGNTKLTYSVQKTIKKTQALREAYSEKMQDISVEYAATNDKGELRFDIDASGGKSYIYTKESMLLKLKAERALLQEEIDISGCIHSISLDNVDDSVKENISSYTVELLKDMKFFVEDAKPFPSVKVAESELTLQEGNDVMFTVEEGEETKSKRKRKVI